VNRDCCPFLNYTDNIPPIKKVFANFTASVMSTKKKKKVNFNWKWGTEWAQENVSVNVSFERRKQG